MERPSELGNLLFEDDLAVMDDNIPKDLSAEATHPASMMARSPLPRTRSMSDGGGTPSKLLLSPSPHIIEAARGASKDDSTLRAAPSSLSNPVTPLRADFHRRGLSLQMPASPGAAAAAMSGRSPFFKPAPPPPLSPKLDHAQMYASPTNIIPRRSRGLDFSRAATSLHHSMLAEQSSPDSSPTIGGRGINIPNRRSGDYSGAELSSTSLWSVMGNQERMHISGSVGSAHPLASDSSSTTDEDDIMDEDMEDAYIMTPQVSKTTAPTGPASSPAAPWLTGGSPGAGSLRSFQQRQRPRKIPRKRLRAPLGLGFSAAVAAGLSKSPPSTMAKDASGSHSRRESISWQANQLHISGAGSEGEDSARNAESRDGLLATPGRDGQRSVIRRVVTRRGNLLPKTKNFARIRAALAEEGAPVESEFRREAEVVRQVRESDMDLEPRMSAATTAPSSPSLVAQDGLDDMVDSDLVGDSALGLSGSFKQQMLKNSGGRTFWDRFPEAEGARHARTTPPPLPLPASLLPRGSSSGLGEDVSMDSPLGFASAGFAVSGSDSQRSETPQPSSASGAASSQQAGASAMAQPPTAAEITRRINSKRRRDDDFDPGSFKRRAVSPGMSVHNSPVMQSPLQRDAAPWGSRPGSNGGDRAGGGGGGGSSGAASEAGGSSLAGTPGNTTAGAGRVNGKGRVGFQGMVDTNDGMMRMSIE